MHYSISALSQTETQLSVLAAVKIKQTAYWLHWTWKYPVAFKVEYKHYKVFKAKDETQKF